MGSLEGCTAELAVGLSPFEAATLRHLRVTVN